MHPIMNIAIKAARNASKIIVRDLDRLYALHVEEKVPNDFVTEVDRKAEQEIIQTIRAAYSQHSILAEESGQQGENEEYLWVIDPLDGTANFIHGIPHFGISIAVKYRGKLEHGVILDPIRQELFYASRGQGAYLNDKRLRVSQRKTLKESLIATGFPFRNPSKLPLYLKSFSAVLPQVSDLRRAGSACLDLAYVAAGRFDGFWEMELNEWDIAAGALLVKEAGGFVSDFKGGETYLTNGEILAANPKIFKSLLQTVTGFS